MMTQPKEQTPDSVHEGEKDGQSGNADVPADAPCAPDSAAPVLRSEDDELLDEDAPK